jgi:hypothetical protein
MFVCCVCCVFSTKGICDELVKRSPTECGASLCVIKKPRVTGGYTPRWAALTEKSKYNNNYVLLIFPTFCEYIT